MHPESSSAFHEGVELLASLGAEIVEVACPHFVYALPAYYLILPAECSSNLAKFDAMRYGLRVGDDGVASAEQVMAMTREAGFGAEVKRRIIIGTYALSSGYYDAYYGQAQKVRTLISRDFDQAFSQVDVLVSPATPVTAFKIGEKVDDPLAMYMNDLCTIPSNLAGNASASFPVGLAPEDGLPVGLQVIAPPLATTGSIESAPRWRLRSSRTGVDHCWIASPSWAQSDDGVCHTKRRSRRTTRCSASRYTSN
jgi:aspartyl-tRNA(Asn)/glutamyl-tRNA(Gln) amidotransferase subunit A